MPLGVHINAYMCICNLIRQEQSTFRFFFINYEKKNLESNYSKIKIMKRKIINKFKNSYIP